MIILLIKFIIELTIELIICVNPNKNMNTKFANAPKKSFTNVETGFTEVQQEYRFEIAF